MDTSITFIKVSPSLSNSLSTSMILWKIELKITSRVSPRLFWLTFHKTLKPSHLMSLSRCKKNGLEKNLKNSSPRTTKLKGPLRISFKQFVHINLINMLSQSQLRKSRNCQNTITGQCIKLFSMQPNILLTR
jgi:hypothetical protein